MNNDILRNYINEEVVLKKFIKLMHCTDLEKLNNKEDLDDSDKQYIAFLKRSIDSITNEIEMLCNIYKKLL